MGWMSCVWWGDVQISSKRKAIDMKVASHMIIGVGNGKKRSKKRVCTVRKRAMSWVGSSVVSAVASEDSKQVYKRTGGEVSVFA